MKTIQIKETQTIIEVTTWKVTDEVFDAIQDNPSEVGSIMQNTDWDDTRFVSKNQDENFTKKELIKD
tara:strand:+ start:79 stop:279 length:201 start_codon:yes stop_codon:yes gene_type:complete